MVFGLLCALFFGSAALADDDKGKKKPEKEKKEKIEPWTELRTTHFLVASDGGEKTARRFGDEFESLLRVFQSTMPGARVSTGIPARILISRDGQSFARVVPEFPFNKNREQPAGLFVAGTEKTYIVLRGNANGRFVHAEIFQNYAREVLKHTYHNLPPWIEEGYSTVYSNLSFSDRGVKMERPEPEDLSVLFESPLLPLEIVLKADRTSPYYSPGDKQSVYFAESRVLLHYLVSDPQFAGTKALEHYVASVENGGDSLQAARESFGDLNQLQAKLEAYVKNVGGAAVDLPAGAGGDSAGPARLMTMPESDARTADFLAVRGRVADAEDKLNDALTAQPALAEAEQSLGFLLLKRDDLDEARKHFEHAAQLAPSDALNFYGLGMVDIAEAGKGPLPAKAAERLEKAVTLNADFAPAWHNLALVYADRAETLPKAIADAKRAAALVPGDRSYQLHLASLVNNTGTPESSRSASARTLSGGSDRPTINTANATPAVSPRVAPPPPSSNTSAAPVSPPPKPDSGAPRIERKTDPADDASVKTRPETSAKAEPAPAPSPVPPLFTESQQVYSMVGTITDVNCSGAPQVQLTLKSQTILMKLHAESLEKLLVKSAGAVKSFTCSSLRGRSARISYVFVTGKSWDAEMQTVEFRSQP